MRKAAAQLITDGLQKRGLEQAAEQQQRRRLVICKSKSQRKTRHQGTRRATGYRLHPYSVAHTCLLEKGGSALTDLRAGCPAVPRIHVGSR